VTTAKSVVIIGAGPAGLAAAHAAEGMNCLTAIIAPKRMTPQRGPIMLHRPIPGINDTQPEGYVRQIVIGGSILDYRLKLYGDVNISISGDILDPGFHTWRVPLAYKKMWYLYSDKIIDGELSAEDLIDLVNHHDLVVNTAPLPKFCLHPQVHQFNSVPIDLVFDTTYPNQPDNTVIYNAFPNIRYVRSSSIFGERVTEYMPGDIPRPDLRIYKPLSTTCDCHPCVLRTGRFGKWHNETWIDHAYYETRTALVSMAREKEWDSIR
jgi:hypothetical protein